MSRSYRIIRLLIDNALSPSLRSATMRWLLSPSDAEEKREALNRLWDEASAESDIETRYSLRQINSRIDRVQGSHTLRLRQLLLRIAVVLLPLISIGLTYLYLTSQQESPEMIEYYATYGSDERITLSDGSVINLNPGSVLISPKQFAPQSRTVYLSGEATFRVEPNAASPFIVRSGALSIKVLGTTFNIQAYPASGEVITTLQDGGVEVFKTHLSHQSHRLKPNDRLAYNIHTDHFTLTHVTQNEARMISEGQLVFTNQPLDKILSAIQWRYGVDIINHTIQRDFYSMKFKKTETIDDVLTIVTKTVGGIRYTHRDNRIHIEKAPKKRL